MTVPVQEVPGAPPRRLIVAAAVVAVILAAAVAVVGGLVRTASQPSTGPLAVPSVPAPQANSQACTALLDALPAQLTSKGTTLARRELAAPAPAATMAWGESDPVVVRCGLERPPELTPTSQLQSVSGVQWLPVSGDGSSTWYVVDRPVYVALTVPDSAGTGPLQEVSSTIGEKLSPEPLRF